MLSVTNLAIPSRDLSKCLNREHRLAEHAQVEWIE